VLQLVVSDTDRTLEAMARAGATVVYPAENFLGERMARLRDPFGHLWILRQGLHALSVAEIQRGRDELFARRDPRRGTPPKDQGSLSEPPGSAQAARRAARSPGEIDLVLGPVGAGKSTHARRLAEEHGAVRLTLDEWMTELFSPDRPDSGVVEWYVERAARCRARIWCLARALLEQGTSVVLEIGLLERRERALFYALLAEVRTRVTIHVLDASREVRRERVAARNRERGPTFSMHVPPAIFELASDRWEPLEPEECSGRDVRFVRTD
jgi:predicted kinase